MQNSAAVFYTPDTSVPLSIRVRYAFNQEPPKEFEPYIAVVAKLWPQLTDRRALLNATFDVYVEIAEEDGFIITPECLGRKPFSGA